MARVIEKHGDGVVVWQVTESGGPVSNIYGERPYVPPDGRRFLHANPNETRCSDGSMKSGPYAHD